MTPGASHPLPTQVIAGQIAIQQVTVKPVGPHSPMHLAQVHHVTGQPHPCVVVQIPCGIQSFDGHINRSNPCAGMQNVQWNVFQIGIFMHHTFVQRFKNTIATMLPNMAIVLTPTQLKQKLILRLNSMLSAHTRQHFRQVNKAVSDVGGKLRHCPVQRIASTAVFSRLNGFNSC